MRIGTAVLGLVLAASSPAGAQDSSSTCRTCHPGAFKGLAQSAHAGFLQTAPAKGACGSCHTGTDEHVRSAALPTRVIPPPKVAPQTCASCHAGKGYEQAPARTAEGAHPFRRVPETRPGPDAAQRVPGSHGAPAKPAEDAGVGGLTLHGSLAGGYRFVDVTGSEARYDQDLNLDEGFRLKEATLNGRGKSGQGLFDRFSLDVRDVDDPYQTYRGELARSGLYRAKGGFEKTVYVYDPGGDFHTYDIDREKTYAGLEVDLGEKWRLFSRLERLERDGIVVSSRIGNQNVQPFTSVSGVRGPRSLISDFAELGVAADLGRTEFSLSGEWYEDDALDQRSWSRASPVNPAFPESEISRTDWSLRGPGGRATLRSDLVEDGSLSLGMTFHYRDLERRTVTDATVRGFDIGEFVTQTDGVSRGTGRTLLGDLTLTWRALERLSFIVDLRGMQHREEQDLELVDVTTYPSLGTVIVTDRSVVLTTRQDVVEGSLAAELEAAEGLTVTLGYGLAREKLRLPDLESGDADFLSGTIRTEGFLAGLLWQPGARWTLSADFRGFGMGQTQLHEVSPDMGTMVKERARYRGEGWTIELVGRHRHMENDMSQTRLDANSVSLLVTFDLAESVSVHAAQTESWVDSTALTNFYFAPDPNPVPGRVGFDGRTDSTVVGFVLRPGRRWTWINDVAFTNTEGDFDVRFLHLTSDLVYQLNPWAEVGCEGRVVQYDDQFGPPSNDYDALIGMLYARLRL